MAANKPTLAAALHEAEPALPAHGDMTIGNGDVLIAAITSLHQHLEPERACSPPACSRRRRSRPASRSSRTSRPRSRPGSRIVTEYLTKAGLLPYLEKLGFNVAAYGCTTCIGNAGDLTPEINEAITKNDLVCAAVLSGNRNFEARIHPNLKANFLASPPLVVAYAIAGTVLTRPDDRAGRQGQGRQGRLPRRHLADQRRDRGADEVRDERQGLQGQLRQGRERARARCGKRSRACSGQVYNWPTSTYIAEPPFFDGFEMQPHAAAVGVKGARAIGLFGDSITTDHISPAGAIKESSPAGMWLKENGVIKADFNSYGSRRGNHDVMMRGTFANVRIKNLMIPPGADGSREEGGVTLFQPSGEKMFIYDAAMKYMAEGTPTIVFGGEEYGTGSSRDWAAKGTQLLGIKAVVAKSFERIHRSQPGRHGRAAAAVQARRLVGVARHQGRRDLRRRGRRRRSSRSRTRRS